MRRRNPEAGLVVFWIKLMQRGYNHSILSLWRVLKRLTLLPVKPPNPKYIAKPYEKMLYPGQRVQIDVKVVPKSCIVPNADGLQERFNIRLLMNTQDFGSLWLLRNNLLIRLFNS